MTGRNPTTKQPLSNTGVIPNEIAIIHNKRDRLGEWVQCIESLYSEDSPRWFKHPTLKDKADFVALPLTVLDDVQLYPYDLSNPGQDVQVGPADTISVIGFPFGLQGGGSLGIWATGFMASEPVINYNDLPIFLIDCRSRQVQSGSPVNAYRSGGMVAMADGSAAISNGPMCKFLGIYSGRINAESDLGIVWKVSAIEELVLSI